MYRAAVGGGGKLRFADGGVTRHFLNLSDAGGDAIAAMFADAIDRKAARAGWAKGKADGDAPLAGHTLGMIFEKNSTRTRASFEMAMKQLGGDSMFMPAGQMQLGRGESIADTARVLSRYVDAIMIRTDDHAKIEELAHYASVPVINGLTDLSHPCQIVADLLTIIESGKALPGLEVAWLGDGNNVLYSLIEAAGIFKFHVRVGVPQGYEPDEVVCAAARAAGSQITLTRDAAEAVAGADIVVTDTWVSMGQDHAHNKIAGANPGAKFLHCLPAHRGEEVTDAVIDGAQSLIWEEAENRLHAQKSILLWCFGLLG
jgi:ornithine carbamoyltransferase